MKKPFVFGVAVEEENFVGRSEEITVLSNNRVHLEVSETLVVSFYRTFTNAGTIRYRYSFASNRPSTVLQPMTAVLV